MDWSGNCSSVVLFEGAGGAGGGGVQARSVIKSCCHFLFYR